MVEISTYLNKCPSSQVFFWSFRDDLGSLLVCDTKTDAIIKTDEFRKSSKQHLTHPLPLLENHVAFSFSKFMLKKPCSKVQICSINFWIENDSPPFGFFLKIHWFCWHHLFLCQKIGLWIYQSKSRKESAELGKKTLPGQPVWVSSLFQSCSW